MMAKRVNSPLTRKERDEFETLHREDFFNMKKEVTTAKEEKATLEEELEDMRRKADEAEKDMEALREELENARCQIDDAKEDKAGAELELREVRQRISALEEENEQLRGKVCDMEETFSDEAGRFNGITFLQLAEAARLYNGRILTCEYGEHHIGRTYMVRVQGNIKVVDSDREELFVILNTFSPSVEHTMAEVRPVYAWYDVDGKFINVLKPEEIEACVSCFLYR